MGTECPTNRSGARNKNIRLAQNKHKAVYLDFLSIARVLDDSPRISAVFRVSRSTSIRPIAGINWTILSKLRQAPTLDKRAPSTAHVYKIDVRCKRETRRSGGNLHISHRMCDILSLS